MLHYLIRCYHAVHHPAVMAERPLHMAYFFIVATEAHGYYGGVAAVCGIVMFLTLSGGEG